MIRKAIIMVLVIGSVLTGLLGVLSIREPITFYLSRDRYCCRLRVSGGRAALIYDGGSDVAVLPSVSIKTLGIIVTSRGTPSSWQMAEASAPTWFVVIALLVCPAGYWAYGPLRRWRRRRRGLCLNCAYDLRGSTERCPECGTEIARKS